jgi:HD-GYP domain-containing protein (c-di-GMP phosphodiesterase class II)
MSPAPSLKKISVEQLRLGMHLHAMEGAWIDHPFWKTKFVLKDAADLVKLRQSAVREVWIDTAKGLDVAQAGDDLPSLRRTHPSPETPAPAASSQPVSAARPTMPQPAAPTPPGVGSTAQRAEKAQQALRDAAEVCERSRKAVTSMFNEVRMGQALDATQCLPLVEEITASVYGNPGAVVSLARLKTADAYTYMHSVAVCALMVALGRQLGLSEADCRDAGLAGLLHDLGKALVPLEILNKPGKLTDEEFAVVRTHPDLGHRLLVEGQGASAGALDVCLHHHERMDGTGYPKRLSGEDLSTLARMGAICDVYDAITSNRPYKAGWDPAESIARMASWKGHFDPDIFRAFVRSLGIYPNGALVRLASGRLAVVLAQNPDALTSPLVKVFFDAQREMPLTPALIDLARSNADKIVDREPPGRWNFPNLDALWAGDAAPAPAQMTASGQR